MAIKCGRCKNYHEDVTGVRECLNGNRAAVVDVVRATGFKPTDKQWDYLNSLLEQAGKPRLGDEQRENFTRSSISEPINDAKIDADQAKRDDMATQAPVQEATQPRHLRAGDYPDVPEGYYAVTSLTGNNDLDFFQVQVPDKGNWTGYLFVKRVIGGGAWGDRLRTERVHVKTAKAWLAMLSPATVRAAQELFGQEIGRCGKCGRSLTDETSRARGIGPDCYARMI